MGLWRKQSRGESQLGYRVEFVNSIRWDGGFDDRGRKEVGTGLEEKWPLVYVSRAGQFGQDSRIRLLSSLFFECMFCLLMFDWKENSKLQPLSGGIFDD